MSRSGPSRLRRALLGYRRSDVHALLAEEARAMDELSARTETLQDGIVARERALAETRREAAEARRAARQAADALRLIAAHLEDLDAAARSEAERIRDQARAELRAARDRVRELESAEVELTRAVETAIRRTRALLASRAGPASRHDRLRVVRAGLSATAEGSEPGAEPPEGDREVARLDSITDELSRLTERLGGASDELDEAAELVLRQASAQHEHNGDPAVGGEGTPATVAGTDVAGRLRRLEERAGAIQALAAGTERVAEEATGAPRSPDGVRTLRVDVGPVEDFETLTRFMDAVDDVEGVERVTIERFSERRAVLAVEVDGSTDVLAELTRLRGVRAMDRRDHEDGPSIVDLADRDAGEAA